MCGRTLLHLLRLVVFTNFRMEVSKLNQLESV
ncbi:hypothetical protein AAHE18_19G114500 [Arachis hypogaea]